MIQTYLSSLMAQSDRLVSSYLLAGKFWKVGMTAVCCFWVLLFVSFDYFSHHQQYILTPVLFAGVLDATHQAHVAGLLTLLEHLWRVAFFYLVLKLTYEITADTLVSSYVGLRFSFIFFWKNFFGDVSTWLIAFAYFFALLAIVIQNIPVLFLGLFLGFWSDGGALLFSPILLLWWKLYFPEKFKGFSLVYLLNIFLYFGNKHDLFTRFIKAIESYKLYPQSTGSDYFWSIYKQFYYSICEKYRNNDGFCNLFLPTYYFRGDCT